MADQSALSASATPAPEEDEVLEFDSWDATPDQASDSEPHDEFQAHTFSDDEEDRKLLNPFLSHESTLTSFSSRDALGGRLESSKARW